MPRNFLDYDSHEYLQSYLKYGVLPRNQIIPDEDKELIAAFANEDNSMPKTKETEEFCLKHFGKRRCEMGNPQLYVIPNWVRDSEDSNGLQTLKEQNGSKTSWSTWLMAT